MAFRAIGANPDNLDPVPSYGLICVTEASGLTVSAGGEVLQVEIEDDEPCHLASRQSKTSRRHAAPPQNPEPDSLPLAFSLRLSLIYLNSTPPLPQPPPRGGGAAHPEHSRRVERGGPALPIRRAKPSPIVTRAHCHTPTPIPYNAPSYEVSILPSPSLIPGKTGKFSLKQSKITPESAHQSKIPTGTSPPGPRRSSPYVRMRPRVDPTFPPNVYSGFVRCCICCGGNTPACRPAL